MYSQLSIEHEQSLVNGFLADKNNPHLINFLVSIVGETESKTIHKNIETNIVTILESYQNLDESLLEELLDYGAIFVSKKILLACEHNQVNSFLQLGFKIISQQDKVLLEWG